MNDQERASQEARAQRKRETAIALDAIGITRAEASLFNVIHYGLTLPPDDLCDRATFPVYAVGDPVTITETKVALAACLAKGWLQTVDEAVIAQMRDEIHRDGLLGPIYGYPSLGGLDFTHNGAKQWFRICDALRDRGVWKTSEHAYCDTVHKKSAYYFRSQSQAQAALGHWQKWESVVSTSGPSLIGPWRANWWRRYSDGYRIEVEHRTKWQGRGPSGGGSIHFDRSKLVVNIIHAQDVLDCHNVQWVEWCVLASMEQSNDRGRIAPDAVSHSRHFGVGLSEAECETGLDACIRNGWLRSRDEQTLSEIRDLLRADSAILAVPFQPRRPWNEVDFTIEGALLYRALSTEILGPDWEDSLQVEYGYYREEHRYYPSDGGLRGVIEEYARSGETPKSLHTIPIGPWCVYWWERFRSGCRLEMIFGQPQLVPSAHSSNSLLHKNEIGLFSHFDTLSTPVPFTDSAS